MDHFLFYALLSIFAYYYFYNKTKDALNPFSISISSLLFSFSLCGLRLNWLQTELSAYCHIAIIISATMMSFAGSLVLRNYKPATPLRPSPIVTDNYKKIVIVISFFTLFAVLYTLISNGFDLKVLNETDLVDKKAAVDVYIADDSALAYITKLAPYLPIFFTYILLFEKNLSFKKRVLLISCNLLVMYYICFILLSKGTLIVPFLGILYIYNCKYNLSLRKIILSFFSFLILATFITFHRINESSLVFAGTDSPAFNHIYNYIVFNYQNLDSLLNHGSPLTIFTSVWISVAKILGLYDPNTLVNYEVAFYNARTFLYYFYHDLDWFGIVLYPALLFGIIGWIYVHSKTDKPYYCIFIAVWYKAIAVVCFGNYFFGFFSMDVAYIVTALLLYYSFNKKQLRIKIGNFKL